MRILRDSSENEVILEFLQGEYESERYQKQIGKIIIENGFEPDIVTQGKADNAKENESRLLIMNQFRGYPDTDMFAGFPEIKEWKYAETMMSDIENIYYINYCYWNDLSKGTGKSLEAAGTIREGVEVYNVSNERFLRGREVLVKGSFRPIIVVTADMNKYLLIEGHSRMTIYGLDPEKFAGTNVYIGICNRDELLKYDKRDIF